MIASLYSFASMESNAKGQLPEIETISFPETETIFGSASHVVLT
jgi:hypothetical protein